jgi:hypothetical protein
MAALQRPDKWMPSPGELRELAGDVRPADRAVLAFQALKTACSRVGAFRSPDFDDPLINATVQSIWADSKGILTTCLSHWDTAATMGSVSRTKMFTSGSCGLLDPKPLIFSRQAPQDAVVL